MSRWWSALLPMVMLLGAGCLQSSGAPDTASGSTQDEQPATIDNDMSGCLETLMLLPVETAHAAGHLPAGYEPLDAGAVVGLPMETGHALVALAAFECDHSGWEEAPLHWGFLGILIQPPELSNQSLDPAELELYNVALLTGGPRQLANLSALNHTVLETAMTVDDVALPLQPYAQGLAEENGSALFEMRIAVPPRQEPFDPSIRFWHEAPSGLALWSFQPNGIERLGATVSCSLRPGSLVAEVAGTTDCAGHAPLGFVHSEMAFEATFTFLPGIHLAA